MKNHVKIALTVAVTLAALVLLVRFFPLGAALR